MTPSARAFRGVYRPGEEGNYGEMNLGSFIARVEDGSCVATLCFVAYTDETIGKSAVDSLGLVRKDIH
jgi:hypothetical protein